MIEMELFVLDTWKPIVLTKLRGGPDIVAIWAPRELRRASIRGDRKHGFPIQIHPQEMESTFQRVSNDPYP